MINPLDEFKQRCRDAAPALVDELVSRMRTGGGEFEKICYEFTEQLVPKNPVEIRKLSGCLFEFWDQIDRSGTASEALSEAIFFCASFQVLGEMQKIYHERALSPKAGSKPKGAGRS